MPEFQVAAVEVAHLDREMQDMIEETLEVRLEQDMIVPAPQVDPVNVAFIAPIFPEEGEELEVSIGPDRVEPRPLVEQVRFAAVDLNVDDELEIFFRIDDQQQDKLMADNADISSADMIGVQHLPEAGTELFYLRESLSMAADIENSRTDMELVRIAIGNPEDLSYEELLFAASLAPVPEDKLKIYHYAFIHIDRDWRAFNNAAVTAMNMKDLDQAEVYLYQASLISTANGKVENNMGILACYKNDFESAENHFLAASQLGINSEYNLQLVKNLVKNRQHGGR